MSIRSVRRAPWMAAASLLGLAALLGGPSRSPLGGGSAAAEDRSDPATYREYDVGDGRVTFDVTDAPLKQVIAERIQPKTKVNLIVAPEAENERVTLRVVDLHWVWALDTMVEKIGGALIRKAPNLLRIERPMPLVMSFENEDIGKVVTTIATSVDATVFVSPSVKGTVTVNLKNVPWKAALRHIVETAGKYSLVEEDYGILRVVPTSDLELGSATYAFRYLRPPPPYKGVVKSGASGSSGSSSGGTAAAGSATTGAEIVESDVFIPSDDPTKAEDMFPIVKALRTIVKPDGGDVTYIPGSNAVLYTGTAPKLARVRQLCEQLDTEPPQIFIDMNFISTTMTEGLSLGMKSDNGFQMGFTGARAPHRLPFGVAESGWADFLSGANFPTATGFSYGTLDFSGTQLLFQAIQHSGCSKLVQAPKILALDNQEATIFVGESIRYARSTAASNQNGGLEFSIEEADNSPVNVGFQLLVIPHVIPGENKIMLLVIPQQRALSGTTSDIPGFERFTVGDQSIDLPRVASSTLVTQMLLRDKETAVIGGLLEDRKIDGTDKIPVLGDLPVLGMLFRGKEKQTAQQNLIITITPRILRGSDAANTTIGDELSGRADRLADQYRQLGAQGAPAPTPAPCAPAAPAPVPVGPTR